MTSSKPSAGAISVCALLGSPLADGLYQRAIIESGACNGFEPLRVARDRPSIIERGEALASAVGCDGPDSASCLRDPNLTWDKLVDVQPSSELHHTLLASLEFAPAIDGVVLREDPLARLARGEVDVPILAGSNLDESRAFTLFAGRPVDTISTWAGFEDHVRAVFGQPDGDRVIAIYPRADFPGLTRRRGGVQQSHLGPHHGPHGRTHPVVRTRVQRQLTVGLVHSLAGQRRDHRARVRRASGCRGAALLHDPFGLGSIGGMALASGAAGAALRVTVRSGGARRRLALVTGALSITVGVMSSIPPWPRRRVATQDPA